MKVISDQDLRVATLSGAVVLFEAGVAREIAEEIGLQAIQMGARAVDSDAPTIKIEVEEPLITAAEQSALVDVMNSLIEKADPEDFKADGSPKATAVNKAAGRSVPQDEREQAWEQALNS